MWLVVVLMIGNFFLFVGVADGLIFFSRFVAVGGVDSGGLVCH